jgi:hypothetical protein
MISIMRKRNSELWCRLMRQREMVSIRKKRQRRLLQYELSLSVMIKGNWLLSQI